VWVLADSFAELLVQERLKLQDHSGEGESSRSAELPREFGRTRRRNPHGENRGPDITLRVDGWGIIMRVAILVFLCFAYCPFLIIQVILVVTRACKARHGTEAGHGTEAAMTPDDGTEAGHGTEAAMTPDDGTEAGHGIETAMTPDDDP